MSVRELLMAAAGASGAAGVNVADVFATSLYTGNGSSQTINNGINLSGNGGLVWTKSRSTAGAHHALYDTVRGAGSALFANLTQGASAGDLSAFNSNGFSVTNSQGFSNWNGQTYASWTFRKAAKFFDVVTWTGNNTGNRAIAHGLGVVPGMVIIKSQSTDIGSGYGDWYVWHRGTPSPQNYWMTLNTTNQAQTTYNGVFWGASAATASQFFVGDQYTNLGSPAQTYVAYFFAHDTSTDGIIRCGSFTTDSSGNGSFNHEWSKGLQFAMIKATSGIGGDWEIYDTARTAAWSGSDARLRANVNAAEDSQARLSASGTTINFAGLSASTTYIGVFIVAP